MASVLIWSSTVLFGIILLLIVDAMGFFGRNHFEVDGRTVLITGGSQGMGRGLAKLLAQKGANVVIVARTQKKLDEAIAYIQPFAKYPNKQRFLAISADVTKSAENNRLLDEVTAWNHGQPPDIVWANAGMAAPGLFIDTDIETMRSQMEINYWAAVYLAHASLRRWLKPDPSSNASSSRPRHFIMTSSVASLLGIAGYTPYAPSKAALRSLADTLRSEINLYNGHRSTHSVNGPPADVRIHCVFPATIISPGLENENKTKHEVTKILEEDDPQQTEDEVAAASIKGLEGGGFLVTTHLIGHALRAGALGGSPRNGWGFVDTVFSWVISVVWLFLGPDMERKVYKYGKTHQVDLPS